MRFLVIVLACAFIVGCDTESPEYDDIDYANDIYGVAVDFGDPVFEHSPKRDFNGDGVSLHIFDLPIEVRQHFEVADESFMVSHPRRPDYRSHWSVVPWSKGPIPSRFEKYVDFALMSADHHAEEIREALSRETTFYSFFHYDHDEHPGNIDLFVVDLESGRIYEINVNT